jgi:hypothetical protein
MGDFGSLHRRSWMWLVRTRKLSCVRGSLWRVVERVPAEVGELWSRTLGLERTARSAAVQIRSDG